ncbi:mannosyltransferase family protein [Curtobacterium sp. RRHDQ10]|uniref:mannosyltransferase family protein n=1 Tax=Curtobacterium phyllosphaerae TaxID=3413379 RepID=UPI003BF44498
MPASTVAADRSRTFGRRVARRGDATGRTARRRNTAHRNTAHRDTAHRDTIRREWLRAIVGSLTLWAISRALVTAIAMTTLQRTRGAALGGRPFTALLAQWDSEHFATIAADGYFPAAADDPGLPAFFPGYPLLARGTAVLLAPLGTDAALPRALALVAALGAVVAGAFVWRVASTRTGERAGLAATALLFFGPYALFLHASYSESTFLAFATAAWWAGTRERWLLAGVLCAAAGATRVNGLFLLAALVVMSVVSRRRERRGLLGPGLPAVLVGACGTATYLVFLWVRTGRPDAWSHAQAVGWGRTLSWPWDALRTSVFLTHAHPNVSARIQAVFDIGFAALVVVVLAWFVARRSWPEAVLVGLTAASLMTSVSFVSLGRNMLTLFPVPIALGRGAARGDGVGGLVGPVLWVGTLVVGVALLTFQTHQFALGLWAG